MVLPLTPRSATVLHHLFAAAAQFRQIELSLRLAQLAIAPLLDAFGQIARDFCFKTAQKQRPQFGREAAAGNALLVFGVLAARLVLFAELLLCPKVARLNEINDAPQIEQAILQRRAGQRQTLIRLQLFD